MDVPISAPAASRSDPDAFSRVERSHSAARCLLNGPLAFRSKEGWVR